MIAAVFEEIGKVVVKDVAEPVRTPGGVLLQVDACTLCGTDLRIFRHGGNGVQFPAVLGHEIAGTVLDAPDDSGVQKGQRVAVVPTVHCGNCPACLAQRWVKCRRRISLGYSGQGGYSQRLNIPREWVQYDHLIPIPDNLPSPYAAIMEPLACVLNAHERAKTRLGDVVLVMGAGAIGGMLCRVARLRGAKTVVLTDVNNARLNRSQHFGADYYVNSHERDLSQFIQDLTGGEGVDVIFTANPDPNAQVLSLALLAIAGRVVFFGGLIPGRSQITIDGDRVHYNDLEIYGLFGSTIAQNRQAMELLASGMVDGASVVTHTVALRNVANAVALAESGEALRVAIMPETQQGRES